MHEIAEYGIAAHALYKDSAGTPTELLSRESSAYAWLRRTIELLAEGSNPEEFLEHTKLELFHDQVFCFTPNGKLIALPRKRDADRFCLCGPYRCRQHGGRLQDQRQDCAAHLGNRERRRGGNSHLEARRPRRRRRGNPSSSPARRAPPSAAPLALRCACNIPGSAAAWSSACFSAPRWPMPTRSSPGRCRGWRARRSRMSCRPLDAVNSRPPTSRARCTLTTRKNEPPRMAIQRKPESGWFGLKKLTSVKFKVPDAQGPAIPIRGINSESAGQLRAQWRRGAGRPHRRNSQCRARASPSIRSSRRR